VLVWPLGVSGAYGAPAGHHNGLWTLEGVLHRARDNYKLCHGGKARGVGTVTVFFRLSLSVTGPSDGKTRGTHKNTLSSRIYHFMNLCRYLCAFVPVIPPISSTAVLFGPVPTAFRSKKDVFFKKKTPPIRS
jgi:hypothetical protein